MENLISGWVFRAFNVRMYEDGKIEWDWSDKGRFAGDGIEEI